MNGSPVSSKWILARTLYRLSQQLSLEPMGMGALAKEYAKTIEEDGLGEAAPIPPGPLSHLCRGGGVTIIHHEGKTCVSWSKATRKFVTDTLGPGVSAPARQEQAAPAPLPEVDPMGQDDEELGHQAAGHIADAAESSVAGFSGTEEDVGEIDFAGDFQGLTPPQSAVLQPRQPDSDDEWTMFVRDKRRTGDDVAYVRRTAIAITARAAASVGLARGSKVTLFSGRPGRIKLQIDASNPNALTMTGDGSTAATLKCSAHAFVRDHRLTLGRYRLEPIGDGAAILTLVEAAKTAA